MDLQSGVLSLLDTFRSSGELDARTENVSALDQLVGMSVTEILPLSQDDAAKLTDLMERDFGEDGNLSPPLLADANGSATASIALAWKLKAAEDVLHRITRDETPREVPDIARPAPYPLPTSALLPSLLGFRSRLEEGIGDIDAVASKNARVTSIDGVPVNTTGRLGGENAQVCRTLWATHRVTPNQLGEYPGRTTSLAFHRVTDIAGPSILLALIQEGINIGISVRNKPWKKVDHGQVLAAETEAANLARCIHFNLLSYKP